MSNKIFLLFLALPYFASAQINTAKPWAYWWWMGSAVNEPDITKNLEDYAAAGFGGMHIIPIYGVKGQEANFIPYLSPKWIDALDYTVKEANRLHLGIDMTLGTGWPFGGPQVKAEDAAKLFKLKKDSTGKYTLDILPTQQKVKRAAPGGEGWVLDHFNGAAVERYLKPFDSVFREKDIGVRAFYNDSYEVYGANWSTDFFKRFKNLRGYDLSDHLDVLSKDTAATDTEKRIWCDYSETISDLLLTDFTKPWVDFSHSLGKIARNEAHGSPANILDLYAQADIPESEFFGSKPYNIPLYRQDPDYEVKRFGLPDGIVLKFASSASNVSGKRLTSSETATWLGNHFKVSLWQIKPIVDESFIGGVNHIFFHGVPYSPPSAPFPGWLFYASTNFNQQSHFWSALPQLNSYIERCQTLLQASKPDNDVLLYFPIYDLWHTVDKTAKIHPLDVHTIIQHGLLNSPLGKTVKALQTGGYSFDFVSDKQLVASKAQGNQLLTAGGNVYKAIVIPPCQYMPLATLEAIQRFSKAGVEVIFEGQTPHAVNGYYEWERRQAAFDRILPTIQQNIAANLTKSLQAKGVRSESLPQQGLTYIRKKTATGSLYFIANQDTLYKEGLIRLSASAIAVRVYDPLHQTDGLVAFQTIYSHKTLIPLTLFSGESVFIETFDKKPPQLAQFKEAPTFESTETPLNGAWKIDFIKGNPSLPQSYHTESLASWTNASDTMANYFSGTARYTLHFKVEDSLIAQTGWLNLGDVREFATVTLNGTLLGTAWSLPFRVPIQAGVLKKENLLEIEVTNLSANRIRYMDRKGVPWKKFYDINMVDIGYRPFDASNWEPVTSGLLGPVSLTTF